MSFFVDIVRRALELEDPDPFLPVDMSGHSSPVPGCSVVNDLMSVIVSSVGLLKKADMMAAVASVLGLTIARAKIKVFCLDWSTTARQRQHLPS